MGTMCYTCTQTSCVCHSPIILWSLKQDDRAVTTALEAQREFLEEALSIYSQRRGIKVVVVYDALNAVSDSVYIHIRTSTRSVLLARISSLENMSCTTHLCMFVAWQIAQQCGCYVNVKYPLAQVSICMLYVS